ncbi:lariat debranching enzyme-like [Plakobranchus ocellatus]|uniref:Lariat debranching enzyme-like n=1 Tax=Plakobranchus ocellatus TaxID=259542 RepID=A0AAV3ZYL1_9GAST|nr:lariat debranching enzyme-like [Plakobranchus ocellatus]
MRIAVEGCCHGELDKIYDTVTELEKQRGFKIDILIICGDFQAVRNFDDLQAMAVPPKYQQLNTFYKYYSGEKVAPVLTVFIGGNHEASNYMQELPYGGWVARNIYYMGYAGIIQVGGVRIGGISGIYKGHDFNKGHFERPPYERDTVRSVYHVRSLEVFRLKQISRHTDIFLSHDWPQGIYYNGDVGTLLKRKPYFKQEIEDNKLGARPLSDLLTHLQPSYWFAAHLHVKFAAHVEHEPAAEGRPAKSTKFLALDKCLPHRHFLQVIEIPHRQEEGLKIKLDPEWLTILRSTDHLLKLTPGNVYMPGRGGGERYDFTVADSELKETVDTFGGDMTLPENFVHTAPPIMGQPNQQMKFARRRPLTVQVNPQTTLLCTMLDITDPNAKFLGKTSQQLLDESAASPAGSLSGGSDSMVDDDEADESGREMPSTINSSMDVSVSSTSASPPLADQSGWDSFHTAHESMGESRLSLPSSASTPCKNDEGNGSSYQDASLVLPAPSNIPDDDDEELRLILSAQKNKSSVENTKTVSASQRTEKCSSLSDPASAETAAPCSVSSSSMSEGTLKPQTFASGEVSETLETSSASVSDSPCDSTGDKPNLKHERSSLGMSGLHLSSGLSSSSSLSASPSFSLGKKRASPSCDVDNSISSPTRTSSLPAVNAEPSPSVKKLKRRNVSMYSEPSA